MTTRGFTVLESMLALSLGMVVLWAGIRADSIFRGPLRRAGEQLQQMEEARRVMWRLGIERRSAGFAGCMRLSHAGSPGLVWRYGAGAYRVRWTRIEAYRLSALLLDAGADIKQGDRLLVSSCGRVDALRVGRHVHLQRTAEGLLLEMDPGFRPPLGEGGHRIASLEVNRFEARAYRVDFARHQLRDAQGDVVLEHVAALSLESLAPGLERIRLVLEDGAELSLDLALPARAS
ncbi:hypothetical protein [Paludibacterium yongneupense]|uniref:hypothetical protein n=1 Tax=Paludibacterium yongneupense TaxID=400061 RepID=UPI0003F728E8|nr:hypothetical protein [Paludibacterium yongneupense]